MSSSSSSPVTSGLYDKLIDQLIIAESKRKFAFEAQKTTQETRKSAISSVGSGITALNSLLNEYTDVTAGQFTSLKPESSDTSFFTVSNSGSLASTGSFQFEIQKLAKADSKVSRQFLSAGNDLTSVTFDSTEFTLNVGGDSAVINVDLTGATTNEDVLTLVADAINAAGIDGVQAAVLNETGTSSRLSIRSSETGSANQISFTDTNDGITNFLSEALELTVDGGADNAALYAGVGGGRLYNVADLDAQFTIDGLQFTRSSNTVTNAINGLTLNLKKVTTQAEEISISSDTENAQTSIDGFLAAFNKVNSDIRTNSLLNSTTGYRGPLYSDRIFKELTLSLRSVAFAQVDVGGGETLSLADIGISSKTDGTLYISDATALTNALETNGEKVQTLFSKQGEPTVTDNGLAVQLQNTISRFIGTDGLVTSLSNSIDTRISQLNDRISAQDVYLAGRRRILKDQYARLEAATTTAQSQYQTLLSFNR